MYILVEQGDMLHKTLKEDVFGEAAGVIICTVAILTKHYPHLNEDEILQF